MKLNCADLSAGTFVNPKITFDLNHFVSNGGSTQAGSNILTIMVAVSLRQPMLGPDLPQVSTLW